MYFTKRLAEQDMIGFLATNASPAMAPYGGSEKLVGNNPQSWSAPTALNAPFILDIAHTTVTRGKINLAKEKHETIPDKPRGVGHFLCAIDISQLRNIDAFTADMQQMIARWKPSQKQAGIAEIYYPGEKEYLHHEECQKHGLMLADDTVVNL